MSNDEELKRKLQEIIDSKEFPFDEASWRSASGFIDNARRGKRRAVYFYIPLILLFIGGSIYVFTTPFTQTLSAPQKAKVDAKPEMPVNTGNTHANNNPSAETLAAPKTRQSTPALPETAPGATQNKPLIEKTVAEKRKPEVTENPATPQNENQTKTPEAPVYSSTVSPSFAEEMVPASTNGTNTSQNEGKVLANQSGNTTETPELASPTSNTISQSNNVPENTNTPTHNGATPVVQNTKPVEEKPIEPQATKTIQAQDVTRIIASENRPEPVIILVADSSSRQTPAIANTPSVAIPDTASLPKPPFGKPKKFIFAEAGLGYFTGWKNNDGRDANSLTPVLGLTFSEALTDKLAVNIGLQYNRHANLRYSNHVSKTTTYKLAEESDVTLITPQTLHYLVIPVKLAYNLNEKSSVGAGINFAYLLDVTSKIETYHQGISGTSNYYSGKTMGYTDGFKTIDSQLLFFYRRNIYKNIWANTEVFYGLSDIKNNSLFPTNRFERNAGIKLTLMYNFFRK